VSKSFDIVEDENHPVTGSETGNCGFQIHPIFVMGQLERRVLVFKNELSRSSFSLSE